MKTNLSYFIEIDREKCTGCQACVLACAYHHSKKFELTRNCCIDISRNNKNGNIEITVDHACCDMCPDDEIPLCMQFCAVSAIHFTRKVEKIFK